MSLLAEIQRAINTPVDYKFIHSVASPICKSMTYVLHESLSRRSRTCSKANNVCVSYFECYTMKNPHKLHTGPVS